MRGVPAWQGRRSVTHPSTVSALRADPPSPTRGEGSRSLATPALTTHADDQKSRMEMISHAHSRSA
ncbi:hypothetical protein FJ967_30335 [Mesorhizobium sp. B2-3-4]|nr:hypothetical protein FJ967_30335 [Mesorhizobium sp. B2-3-4]